MTLPLPYAILLTMVSPTKEPALTKQQTAVEHIQPTPDPLPTVGAAPVRSFRRWYWAGVPLLAFIAYVTVLRIGFLSDDLVLLNAAQFEGLHARMLLPDPTWSFYRPVGDFLTWRFGWLLWGYNPLPYHLLGLLMHMGASLALGLWLAAATRRRALGWLAGALFAVFPAHLEAVGWLAAQWDALAVLFALLSLLCFTMWWRRTEGEGRAWSLYAASTLFYALGLFTKESVLTFLPLLGLSAWLSTGRLDRQGWRRLAFAMLPFVAALALNVALRFLTWGRVGGYPGSRSDFGEFFWDGLTGQLRGLLSPVNPAVLGNTAAQVTAALSCVALLAGLTLYGRYARRVLAVSGVWIALALLPVLNLAINPGDLQQNRFLYLPAAGYCAGVAALLYWAIASARRWRGVGLAFVGVLLLLCTAASWAQLRPWHTATVQAEELAQELYSLAPTQPQPQGMIWYTEDRPDTYKGAYLYRLGLGNMHYFNGGDAVFIEEVRQATEAPIGSDKRDAFALRFAYDEGQTRYHVDYAAGLSAAASPPSGKEAGANLLLWDFGNCAPDTLAKWQVYGAQTSCEAGKGLILRPAGVDAHIEGPPVSIQPPTESGSFVRLRVQASYPASSEKERWINQWFWKGEGGGWSEKRSRSMPIKRDSLPHVYWTFLSPTDVKEAVTGLRFDPANSPIPAELGWIAVDGVK